MTLRHFTVEEANALLPQLAPLVGALLEKRARVARAQQSLRHVIGNGQSDVGNAAASQVALEMAAIEALIGRIRAYGCQLKDINIGLLDFPARYQGREVLLCWRYGESRIEYYHELHTGFMGRRRLD